jgi:signal transduction histidine kinase
MHNFREIAFPLNFNKQWYRVTIAKPLEGVHHLSQALLIVSLITILATILISLFLNRLYLRRLWKPFYESISIMRNFKIGSSESLIFPRTNIEEFSFMNESLSIASEKAKQDFLLLKEFTENASHEMQTPLSIIRSKLDVLIQDKNLSEKQSELVESSYASIKKLSRLNQSLLLLTKIENQQFDLKNQIDLKSKITQKINQFSELWDSYLIKSHIELNESYINMSPELLDILLNNLFSNAINHNITPGFIQIELNKRSFIIQNKGSNDKLDDTRLFSRFYKATINSKSNGLGLSIVNQICKVSKIDLSYKFQSDLHSFSLSW